MSVISEIESIFGSLVPASMKTELGAVASAFVANIKYDMKQLGLEAEKLAEADIEAIWTAVKSTVADVMQNPAFLASAADGQIAVAAGILVSDAAKNVIPALQNAGQTTITTMATTARAMLVAGVTDAAQGQLQSQVTAAANTPTPAAGAAPTTAATAAQ